MGNITIYINKHLCRSHVIRLTFWRNATAKLETFQFGYEMVEVCRVSMSSRRTGLVGWGDRDAGTRVACERLAPPGLNMWIKSGTLNALATEPHADQQILKCNC